ncbi:uncharacterized protein LAESUDRAFT_773068 [Laetiporus sulphureus 93-53]|uniref:Uncharacterized protein n=1 Tax=Laetiporus sulphureus 93-53 TaxID=1314785 RepID=A0A165AT56_9APHY|nr:uncharacterized protein LAESUDRAFT_773068 [Laetiporus sulphureus 93-53]KZS99611.1 hypothetical protein LAESUDRAFT_773068 [Laetiporus sulphureus 93-53]
MQPRYIGPYVVLFRNQRGVYVLSELDEAVLDRPIAAFKVVPFTTRKKITISKEMLDASESRLKEISQAEDEGEEEPEVEDSEKESRSEEEDQQAEESDDSEK